MNTAALVRIGDLPTFSAVPEVLKDRDAVLSALKEVMTIDDQFAADCASASLSDAVALSRLVEKGRTEVKAPVLLLGKSIDSVAKEITALLEPEIARVQRLMGTYLEAQRRAQAALEAEARRIEAEKIAAAAKEPDSEKAAETIREAVRQTNEAVASVAPPKMAGMGLRQKVEVEVFNPAELYAARPDLVELKPRLALIKEALVATKDLPGVRVTTEAVATVRTSHAAS